MAKAWHLTSRPHGLPSLDNFALRELPDEEEPELRDGAAYEPELREGAE